MKLAILGVFFACLLCAQSTTGTLVGTVTDSSGAAIAAAKVKATNDATGISVEAVTNASGDYVIPNLAAASYKIQAEVAGFRTVAVSGIRLLLNATVRTDIRLEPGAIEQSISVEAVAPVVSSETSSVASVVDAHSVVTLPLNGRTLDRLILITAGNTSDSPSNPKLAGSLHWGGNFYTMDGVAFNDLGNGGAAYSYRTALSTTPSVDTIQEFKIETNNAKAEYEGSAAISMISKSGSNELHGSLYEFNRNRVLAAKQFFATSQPKPAFNRNEFGATVGGPVIRNRTFFFGSYEGLRQRTASTPFLSYGTAAMRGGDFSGLAPVRDPLSGDNFANNRIPTSRLDSRSLKLLEYVPLPNTSGSGPAGTGQNYVTSVGNIIDVTRYGARLDHQLNSRHALSVVLNYSKGSPYFVYNGGPNSFGNFSDGGYITKSASLGYNRTLTPTTLNEFRYAYFNHASIRIGQNTSFNPASLFPQLYQPLPIGGLPNMSITGFSGIGDSGGSDRAPQITQELTDNFSFIRGSHTFKAGLDAGFGRISTNPSAGGAAFGSFSFNGRYSNNAYADFLMGYPVSATRATPGLVNLLYNTRYGLYFQDDWKVSPKLTLNLGVRYTLQTATQERDGSFANFDFGNGNYVIRTAGGQLPRLAINRLLAAYPYVSSEKNGWGSDVLLSDWNNFAPRFGFAYRPSSNNRTVVRGGYGIYYNIIPVYIGIRQISLTNTPFLLSESFEAAAGNTPSLTLASPFPGAGNLSPNPNITAVNRQVRNTYAQQWNLTVERELAANLGLRLSYIGNKATRVPWYTYERNLPLTQAPGTIQSRRPYQPWASISTLDTNGGSITHQMQVEVIRRYHGGLYVQANYTWNKTLDNVPIVGSPQNPYNAALDRADGDQIRHHVFYFSSTYDLPFGPGKKFLSAGGAAGRIVGGWGVAGILQIRSGTPFSVGFSPNQAGWYANRANLVSSDLYPAKRDIEGWFNPAAFAIPAPFTFGSGARNLLFGPGQSIIDVSLLKDTKITERTNLQFRAEFFNLPNHPSFGNPASNISVAGVSKIRGVSVEARAIQFGLKLLF
ncbi:MAG: carboxypeptidase regulatory-like domain-containing protein [Acidobacteria bacterium]|nr:carboxypeptidase regulatory-like domain-containing protein [Acidobacteriota bacterium]